MLDMIHLHYRFQRKGILQLHRSCEHCCSVAVEVRARCVVGIDVGTLCTQLLQGLDGQRGVDLAVGHGILEVGLMPLSNEYLENVPLLIEYT